jgi:lysophospholipase L1-like esterase
MRYHFLFLVCLPWNALSDLPTVDAAEEFNARGNIVLRGSLHNSRLQFLTKKKGHVAFMGGSITEMNGYRPLVCELLQCRFPATKFTFTDAGIASTCSTTGAFRLERDVLSKGPLDLFFVEFAVNDDQDAAHSRRAAIRGMEGIIRQVRKHNPCADVVMVHFVNPPIMEAYGDGRMPISIAAHEAVARHYGISTVNLAREVTQQIAAGDLSWKEFGGTHPGPQGNAMCARMIDELLTRAWPQPPYANAAPQPHSIPQEMLDELSYATAVFVDPRNAQAGDGWQWHVPDWTSLAGACRQRFAATPMLCGETAGAELALTFHGTTVGAYVLAGPDAGTLEVIVDDGQSSSVDLYHRYSRGLHYPRTVILATDLASGEHVARIKISADKNLQSTGHAIRILQFAVNEVPSP